LIAGLVALRLVGVCGLFLGVGVFFFSDSGTGVAFALVVVVVVTLAVEAGMNTTGLAV
jgi:hypothetical protein